MVQNPVYRQYIRYFTRSRLYVYESSVPGVAELAAVRQVLRMKSRKSSLEILSNTSLIGVPYIYLFLPVTAWGATNLRDSLILLTESCTDRTRLVQSREQTLKLLLKSLDYLGSWLVLTCSKLEWLPTIVKTHSPKTVFTYAGGGITGSVYIKNSRSSTKKEYYRLKNLPYYRRYISPLF